MNNQEHIKLLVLPELFPAFEGDWKGVFIEDYLKSVEHLTTQTLYIRLIGKQQGIIDENFRGQFKIRRFNLTNKRLNPLMKLVKYFSWFREGVKLGVAYSDTTIIHAHGAVLNGTLAYLIGKKLNVPFVVTEHTGPYSRILNSWIKSKISKFVFNRAAKVLVVSDHQKNEVLKLGVSPEKVEVSYNPVNTNVFKVNEKSDSKNIAFVSRLDEFKGGLRTLKAFHKIRSNYPDYHLTIVGDGEEFAAIKSYIDKNNLQDKVSLKGTLTKPEIKKVYAKASFFVFPSRFETFGLVVAEALSCGLPVVCTNETAPKEFVSNKNGILVQPDSVDEIAAAMEQLIVNRSNYNSIEIHQEIEERFGLRNFGKYLTEVYEKAMICAE